TTLGGACQLFKTKDLEASPPPAVWIWSVLVPLNCVRQLRLLALNRPFFTQAGSPNCISIFKIGRARTHHPFYARPSGYPPLCRRGGHGNESVRPELELTPL